MGQGMKSEHVTAPAWLLMVLSFPRRSRLIQAPGQHLTDIWTPCMQNPRREDAEAKSRQMAQDMEGQWASIRLELEDLRQYKV